MNRIIAASALADLLASAAGTDRRQAETFIREYFATIHKTLASGDDVHIKGLGSFILTADDSAPIRFEPSADMMSVVNAPFEMFEPMPLNPGDVVETIPVTPPSSPCPPEPPVTPPAESPATDTPDEPTPPPFSEPQPQPQPGPVSTFIPPSNPIDYGYDPEEDETSDSPDGGFARRHPWILASIALIIGLGIGLFAGLYFGLKTLSHKLQIIHDEEYTDLIDSIEDDDDYDTIIIVEDTINLYPDTKDVSAAEESDTSAVTLPQAIPDSPRAEISTDDASYDTVSRTVFLTTLARRHYGQMEYWVYIYDANPDLGNPNSIEPGTRVLIPNKASLPLTGNNEADIAAAKKRSAEIYANYPSRK